MEHIEGPSGRRDQKLGCARPTWMMETSRYRIESWWAACSTAESKLYLRRPCLALRPVLDLVLDFRVNRETVSCAATHDIFHAERASEAEDMLRNDNQLYIILRAAPRVYSREQLGTLPKAIASVYSSSSPSMCIVGVNAPTLGLPH